MNKKEYEAMRQKLLDEAQALINEGKGKEAQDKMNEVKALDDQWDVIAQAQANFNALSKDPQYKGPEVKDGWNGTPQDTAYTGRDQAWESDDYKTAWAKAMMGKTMTDAESKIFTMVNASYTHTTENTPIVIPKQVSKQIWELAGETYPYFAAATKTYVKGTLSTIQEDTSTDAAWYDEATSTEDGKEAFKGIALNGCELSRAITVSWKLKEMAIEDFIPYIIRKLAKKMGAAAGYGATHGKGVVKDAKPEPTGVVTALMGETGHPQVVSYDKAAGPSYTDITKARSKVKSGYGKGLVVYANSKTIWDEIANIKDANKRPIFMADPREDGGFKILGMSCREDDSMKDGEILISNAAEGYHININKETSVSTEDHVKARNTDYCAYAIMDGGVITTRAHALLTYSDNIPAQEPVQE